MSDNPPRWFMERESQARRDSVFITARTSTEQTQLYRMAARYLMVIPHPGMFVSVHEWEQLTPRMKAVRTIKTIAAKHPDWCFCMQSAAAVYGLEVDARDLQTIYVAKPRGEHRRDSAHVRRVLTHGAEPHVVDGVMLTPPLETTVDCLCAYGFARGLAVADSAMRMLGLSKGELYRELGARGPSSKLFAAHKAVEFANPRSENGGESIARAMMIRLGFAIPQLQVEVPNPVNPEAPYRADYYWSLQDGTGLVGELDGWDKYLRPDMTEGKDVLAVMTRERLRESRIIAGGIRVMRFSFKEATDARQMARILTSFGVPREEPRDIGWWGLP